MAVNPVPAEFRVRIELGEEGAPESSLGVMEVPRSADNTPAAERARPVPLMSVMKSEPIVS